MKDPNYVRNLQAKIFENRERIEQIEKENIDLKKQQKKTERLIAKKEQYALAHPDQDFNMNFYGGGGPEVQELDNEIQLLQHKLGQIKAKDSELTREDLTQREKFQKLRIAEYRMANKELKMIEMGKKMYNIDFSDHSRIIEEAENEERKQEKQQLLKKINIIKQSMEVNKKNYQTHMKVVLKQRKEQERDKQAMLDHITNLDREIAQAQEEFKEKKEAYHQLQKQRKDAMQARLEKEREEQERIQAMIEEGKVVPLIDPEAKPVAPKTNIIKKKPKKALE